MGVRLIACAVVLMASSTAFAEDDASAKRLQLAFLGIHPAAGIDEDTARAVSSFAQTELDGLQRYRVIGGDEIQALLGLEAQKQLLGCSSDNSCLAEIGGALGADRALVGDVSRLGTSVVINVSLMSPADARVIAREGLRVKDADSVEPLLDVVPGLLRKLTARDAAALAAAGASPGRSRSGEGIRLGWAVGLRGDIEVTSGAVPGVMVRARVGSRFAAALTALVHPWGPAEGGPVGARAELRVHLLDSGKLSPFVGAGVTTFFSEALPVSARAGAGVEYDLGRLLLFGDFHYERAFGMPEHIRPNSFLLGVGLAVEL